MKQFFFGGILLILASSPILSGCKSASKGSSSEALAQKPKDYKIPETQQLTQQGESLEARFSPDGKKLIYISRKRPSHAHSQVYIIELATKKERRITYHDGENRSASFSPKGNRILYSSTTDEIKENPSFIRKALKNLKRPNGSLKAAEVLQPNWNQKPFEIYASYFDGNRIERLTNSHNFDGEARFHPLGRKVVFSSTRKGSLDIHLMSVDGTYLRRITRRQGQESEPSFSPDGRKLIWVQFSQDMSRSHLVISDEFGKQVNKLTSNSALYWSPAWHPDNDHVLFSSDFKSPGNFEIYIMKINGRCTKRLTWDDSQDLMPELSPDGKMLTFTSNRSGRLQVYLRKFVPPSSCL